MTIADYEYRNTASMKEMAEFFNMKNEKRRLFLKVEKAWNSFHHDWFLFDGKIFDEEMTDITLDTGNYAHGDMMHKFKISGDPNFDDYDNVISMTYIIGILNDKETDTTEWERMIEKNE